MTSRETYRFSEHKKPVQTKDTLAQEFFRHFAKALTDSDTESIMNMWAVPAFVVSETTSMVVKTREEVGDFFAGAAEEYNEKGIFEAIPDIQSIQWVTPNIALVDVRWPYIDRGGQELGEESSVYTLRMEDHGALKIHAVIMKGATPLSADSTI